MYLHQNIFQLRSSAIYGICRSSISHLRGHPNKRLLNFSALPNLSISLCRMVPALLLHPLDIGLAVANYFDLYVRTIPWKSSFQYFTHGKNMILYAAICFLPPVSIWISIPPLSAAINKTCLIQCLVDHQDFLKRSDRCHRCLVLMFWIARSRLLISIYILQWSVKPDQRQPSAVLFTLVIATLE